MDIYAQQGYGKKDRVELGVNATSIKGVVLSPNFEKPDNLGRFVSKLRTEFGDSVSILLDPQFYALTLKDARQGRLPEYAYFHGNLGRTSFSPSSIVTYVGEVVEYQRSLKLNRILSPTVYFSSFDDGWATIAFQLAQASAEYKASVNLETPMLASFVFDISALKSPSGVLDFLNEATLLDVDGFYIVIGRQERTSRDQFDEISLVNLMRLVNGLSEHNGYEVVCGYTDFVGLLLHAVGAQATGVGWSNTSRRFSLSRWEKDVKQGGGGGAPARYTAGPLLTTLSVANDLVTVARAGQLSDLRSSTAYESSLPSGNQQGWTWTHETACLHHWQVLADQAKEVSSQGSTAENLRAAENIIKGAIELYGKLRDEPTISLDASAWRPNLETWLRAISSFRKEVGI